MSHQTGSKRLNWMERRQKARMPDETAGVHFIVCLRLLRYSSYPSQTLVLFLLQVSEISTLLPLKRLWRLSFCATAKIFEILKRFQKKLQHLANSCPVRTLCETSLLLSFSCFSHPLSFSCIFSPPKFL